MSRRTALVVIAAVLVTLVAILVGWKLGQRHPKTEPPVEVDVVAVEQIEGATMPVELFFPGRGGRLYVEQRQIQPAVDIQGQLTRVLDELLAGPESADLYPVLPAEITVGWTHLNPQAVAFVDLEVGGEVPMPAWGSRHEMVAVYSIVNTILANVPEIEAVVILRNGQQQPTFAGHLDTSRPLLANRQLVASR